MIFDHTHADCGSCELRGRCESGRTVPGRPSLEVRSGGLMLIGEGPGATEVSRGKPFVGAAGRELNEMLEFAEIRREDVHLTNATLCAPPAGKGEQGFLSRFPNAVPACLGRLEKEIAHYRPRVVVTLGRVALAAATGYWYEKNKHVPLTCDVCLPSDRKVGPAIHCAAKGPDTVDATGAKVKGPKCTWYALKADDDERPVEEWHAAVLAEHPDGCPACGAKIHRLKPRRIKCPKCGGRKKEVVTEQLFKPGDHVLLGKNGVAGALFEAERLPARWDRYGVKYIITALHPSFILRSSDSGDNRGLSGQFAARVTVDHLAKAKRLLERDALFRVGATITDQAADLHAFTSEPGVYDVDIETDAKSAWDVSELRCIGIGKKGTDEVLVVDTRDMLRVTVTETAGEPNRFSIEVIDKELCGAVVAFLVDEACVKEGQNFSSYDVLVLRRLLGVVTHPVGDDAKIAHHCLWPDEPHTLGHIASAVTEAPYWKPPKASGGIEGFKTFTDLSVYNAKDVRTTDMALQVIAGQPLDEPETVDDLPLVPPGLVKRYRRGGQLRTIAETHQAYALDCALAPLASEMEFTGIPVNLDMLRKIGEEQQPIADELEEWLCDYVGPLPEALQHSGKAKRYGTTISLPKDRINLGSPSQLAWALYDPNGPCRLVCPKKTSEGSLTTEKDVLAKLADHEFVATLLRWRGYNKTLSTYVYGDGLITREDGRIHPVWNITGAKTGRWSSSPNFQNWPLWLRAAVLAMEGWQIVGADYSQLELRIMAALSGDPELIRRCRDADEARKLEPEWDPHSFVASHFFGAAFTELRLDVADEAKRRKALREVIKSCIYGMNYGAGAATVLEAIYKKGYSGVPITLQIVKQAVETIFALFPGIPAWRDQTLERAQGEGEVRSCLLNRWRFFPRDVEGPIAWNFPIQSTGADIVNQRFLVYAHHLKREVPSAQIMAQVHDAVYTLCRDEDVETVKRLKNEHLSVELSLVPGAPPMPFVATAKAGKSWDLVS